MEDEHKDRDESIETRFGRSRFVFQVFLLFFSFYKYSKVVFRKKVTLNENMKNYHVCIYVILLFFFL